MVVMNGTGGSQKSESHATLVRRSIKEFRTFIMLLEGSSTCSKKWVLFVLCFHPPFLISSPNLSKTRAIGP
jgi:hypothetical protein